LGFTLNFYKFSKERVEKVNQEFFNTVNQITNLTGNLIDAKGRKVSSDLFFELLEKMYIPFDDEGNAIMPSWIAGPELASQIIKLKETNEDKEKLQSIIEKKKKDFYAKKHYRRLSYVD